MQETKIQSEKLDLVIPLTVPLDQSYACYVRLEQLEELVK